MASLFFIPGHGFEIHAGKSMHHISCGISVKNTQCEHYSLSIWNTSYIFNTKLFLQTTCKYCGKLTGKYGRNRNPIHSLTNEMCISHKDDFVHNILGLQGTLPFMSYYQMQRESVSEWEACKYNNVGFTHIYKSSYGLWILLSINPDEMFSWVLILLHLIFFFFLFNSWPTLEDWNSISCLKISSNVHCLGNEM